MRRWPPRGCCRIETAQHRPGRRRHGGERGHRALRHHAEGIFLAEQLFGVTVTLSTGRIVPVRLIGEQHVLEDLGRIPSFADWVRAIRPEPWMGRASSIPGAEATAP